ncbi:Proline-rich protein PRCC [Ceraceosorus bombacis]|uniref:Proline-rich protein PRCC n=1 Tax=Ceraceosorus bombacis TaxID=401625 RepID=A0A0P1BNK1_9BASI|nr:Proline-rich protein PRCC [Ceraceosorus bombacis]
MPLVSGYDSDSGSDEQGGPSHVTGPSKQTSAAGTASHIAPSSSKISKRLASLLPAPTTTSGSKHCSAQTPAPPKKRQINIASLSSLRASNGESEGEETIAVGAASTKRPRLEDGAEKSSEGKKTHSLLGMLPAVKGPPPPKTDQAVPASKGQLGAISGSGSSAVGDDEGGSQETTDLANGDALEAQEEEEKEDLAASSSAQSSGSHPSKGNDAFRAMLGLPPSAKPAPNSSQALKVPSASMSIPRLASATPRIASSSVNVGARHADAQERSPAQKKDTVALGGFFGLDATEDAEPATHSTTKGASLGGFKSKFSVQAAPTLNSGEAEAYPGWTQDPDGTWVPITPAAHAQYASWLSSQSSEAAVAGSSSAGRRSLGTAEANAELARAGLKADQLYTIDAGRSASEAYEAPSNASNRQAPAAAARSDARYAAVAAAMKQAQANGGVVEGEEEDEDRGGKKKDKKDKAGFRARQKGQLSALFAHADEERERLEEKWAAHRSNKRKANERYGF